MTSEKMPNTMLAITVDVAQRAGWAVVGIAGELDIATVPQVESTIKRAIAESSAPRVALDLVGLDFCDSSGLGMLVRVLDELGRAGGQLLLMRPGTYVRDRLHSTGLERKLPIGDELPDSPDPAPA